MAGNGHPSFYIAREMNCLVGIEIPGYATDGATAINGKDCEVHPELSNRLNESFMHDRIAAVIDCPMSKTEDVSKESTMALVVIFPGLVGRRDTCYSKLTDTHRSSFIS